MHTRRFWAARFIGAAIMVLAAGCGSAGGNAALTATAPKPEEPDITVAAIPAVDLAGLYIALNRGLFAQQGLHVTIVKIPSSQAVVTDQLTGQVDISAWPSPCSSSACSARRPPPQASGEPWPGRWWTSPPERVQVFKRSALR
jgi:ABC-type nitrate/sulfonate/bicarbonate transport system substrate-binding protein